MENNSHNALTLKGNWHLGWALDYHTTPNNDPDNKNSDYRRTQIGELLYLIKYQSDYSRLNELVEIAAGFIKARGLYLCLDAIVPVPPSNLDRYFQPVYELALQLGKTLTIKVFPELIEKTKDTSELKNIESRVQRKNELSGAFKIESPLLKNKSVLLLDDLFRSGETLREITRVLYGQGEVKKVYVLTVTKTRSKR